MNPCIFLVFNFLFVQACHIVLLEQVLFKQRSTMREEHMSYLLQKYTAPATFSESALDMCWFMDVELTCWCSQWEFLILLHEKTARQRVVEM